MGSGRPTLIGSCCQDTSCCFHYCFSYCFASVFLRFGLNGSMVIGLISFGTVYSKKGLERNEGISDASDVNRKAIALTWHSDKGVFFISFLGLNWEQCFLSK
ncbi:hypothetical protein CEXT_294841 [Caerostris extrusa]|uniref:Uncharacterized protein n=1 Tax=Caerostris extrusa TaxID=172846 RepID=A0AAV4PEX1_CAEEX|nr:hypothetical protein CEXT_294841 [Caerostris extrusa]